MSPRRVFLWAVTVCLLAGTGYGQGKEVLKNYFNEMALRVKATSSPLEKREILSTSISAMSRALEAVRQLPIVPESDRKAIIHFESSMQDKQNELLGVAGYTRVPDEQLNTFAQYTVQQAEQGAEVITISLVTLLLIIIIIILLL